MRKQVVSTLAFATCLWGAIAFAQDASTTTAAPAAEDAAASAPADDAIHLHMPVHRRAAAAKPAESVAPAESPSVDAIGADSATPPAAATPAPLAAETPVPSQPEAPAKPARSHVQKSAPTIPFTFGEDSGTAPAVSTSPQNPEPRASVSTRNTRTASLPPRPEVPKAATEPAAPVGAISRTRDEQHDGLKKRGAVLFDKGVTNPSPSQFQGVKLLAGEVSTALESGASRVQLEAYAGAPGDKSSDARRLSLKRALAVRQLLIDSGIPSNRIDVRAMGGAEDKGPDDRVDVFVRAS
ncbi:MAG TPA: OmpA family protein [Rhizomicrobium sp.]